MASRETKCDISSSIRRTETTETEVVVVVVAFPLPYLEKAKGFSNSFVNRTQ